MLDDAIELIQHFEGLSLAAYRDPVGIWTIGWGATVGPTGQPIQPNQTISKLQADQLLSRDVAIAHDGVMSLVKIILTYFEQQALTSFAFNVGVNAFARSTLLRKLNEGDRVGAAQEFDRWVFADGIRLAGLVRRRKAERLLFEGKSWRIPGVI